MRRRGAIISSNSEWHKVHNRLLNEDYVRANCSNQYSRISYMLPVPKDKIIRIVSSSVTHIGNLCNAVDFLVPEGTEVYAAANGVITALKDDSDVGGFDPQYWYQGNYVVIRHDGESTSYEHLKYKSIIGKVGDVVQQGQLIGYSGNTGYSRGPHLHFEVMEFYGPGDKDYVTLKVRFKDFSNVYEAIAKSRASRISKNSEG